MSSTEASPAAEGAQDARHALRDHLEVHESWARSYRTAENEGFYRRAFDHVQDIYGDPGASRVLDAGCGSSTKSIQLAQRGYRVVGVDLSHRVLSIGRATIAERGLQNRVSHHCADLTALPFANETFERVLCWGVLMHVPDAERAIAELTRITAPGGTIIVSENNMHSLQAVAFRGLKRVLGRTRVTTQVTPRGIETWERVGSGRVMTRVSSMPWLIRSFQNSGALLTERRAGEFTQIFTLIKWRPLRTLVHALNAVWFLRLRFAGPAFCNLLVFRKQ